MRTPLLRSVLSVSGFALVAAALPAATLHMLPAYFEDGYDFALGLADTGPAAGNSLNLESSAPVMWAKDGTVYSAPRALPLPSAAAGGELRWISADGALLAGFAALPLVGEEAANLVPVVWSLLSSGDYKAAVLPRLGGDESDTMLTGGSATGTRFVGQSGAASGAAVWRGAPGATYTVQALALPPDAVGVSNASALSADGTRAVGQYETSTGSAALLWTETDGAYSVSTLQALPGGIRSFAETISRDGTLAAGASDDADLLRPVVWNVATRTVTKLETLPGFEATALAIADNKAWLGGRATDSETFESNAVLWNSGGQIFDLGTLASAAGVSLGDFQAETVTGIRLVAAGLYTIVGAGITAEGATQGFVLENLALATPVVAEPEPESQPEPSTPPPASGDNEPPSSGLLSRRQQRFAPAAPSYPSRTAAPAEQTLGSRSRR